MPVPAAAPPPSARTHAEGKLDPPIPPRIGPAPLKSAPRSHTSQERPSEIAHFPLPPANAVWQHAHRRAARDGIRTAAKRLDVGRSTLVRVAVR